MYLKKLIKSIRNKIKFLTFILKVHFYKLIKKDLKIVIGSADTKYKGWLITDMPWFDITNLNTMRKYLQNYKVSNILAEHVFEHLKLQDGYLAIQNLKEILKSGGKIRIAVPDGYHTNLDYINLVKPGGTGDANHKELYNYKSILKIFDNDFQIDLLEHFNEKHEFIYNDWQNNNKDGYIKRSRFTDHRNDEKNINYSSLILDAYLKK